MRVLHSLLKISFIFSLFNYSTIIQASVATVSQTGNIIHITSKKYGDYILLGDPTLHTLSSFEFEIIPRENKLEKEEKIDINDLLYNANQLYNLKKYQEASLIIEKALKLQPDSVKARAMRGSLKSLLGDKEGARRDWQEALESPSLEPALKEQLKLNLSSAK